MMNQRLQEIEIQTDQLKSQYQTAITILQSHVDETAWTNTKIINAVVFQSKVLLVLIKFIFTRLT